MSTRIPENLQLLGLIVTTRPFSYENNTVKASLEIYSDLDDLYKFKTQLEEERNLAAIDMDKQQLDSDIYFVNNIIQSLEDN